VGSTANFHSSGLLAFGLVPRFGVSNAGIDIVANAVVVGFTPKGIPIVDFTDATIAMPWQPQQRRGDLQRDLRSAQPGLGDDKTVSARADARPRLHRWR
jgi:hypothetical protein